MWDKLYYMICISTFHITSSTLDEFHLREHSGRRCLWPQPWKCLAWLDWALSHSLKSDKTFWICQFVCQKCAWSMVICHTWCHRICSTPGPTEVDSWTNPKGKPGSVLEVLAQCSLQSLIRVGKVHLYRSLLYPALASPVNSLFTKNQLKLWSHHLDTTTPLEFHV